MKKTRMPQRLLSLVFGADDAHQRPAGQRHGGGTDAV